MHALKWATGGTLGFALLISSNSWALSYRLFHADGTQVENYDKIIAELRDLRDHFPIDTSLVFGDGAQIPVSNYLGEGKLTAVFKRSDGKVLRVPLGYGNYVFEGTSASYPYTQFMKSFMIGYHDWGKTGATVRVFENLSFAPQYITVAYFDFKFTLWDFYIHRSQLLANRVLYQEQIPNLERRLLRLAQKVAPYKYIWDFRDLNIASDGRDWLVLDIGDHAMRAQSVTDPTLFDQMDLIPPDLRQKIRLETQSMRRALCIGAIKKR